MSASNPKEEGDVERAAFLNQLRLEIQKAKSSLDKTLHGTNTHGLEVVSDEESPILRLRSSSFTALELVPEEDRNAVTINNYLGDRTGSVEEEVFSNPAEAAQRFEELAPQMVERFEDRIEELRLLGIVQ
ncbi:hypothetical protein DYI37_02785 [Fulvimarina endophytica]|uniref:Uncharacterized protein n=1 Tax=Fulvimarina endophytica TaxID=2293836 RepID=A0A371XAX5_9HYPH|nr:hypothetical protein [Fulvimarina endophytica]RFC66387.1 hypothetical protein DYI37_02785 [Fulvimarina endophytica]